ncbi:MAG TPA: hypothetical protein VJU58_04040 [Microbacterium sp.]|nr:hypothetical protein [Microbacterium sp.]
MAKRQPELPNTRRDDEPDPPKPIKALDDACDLLEKAKGKATRAGQAVVEAKKAADALLVEHGLVEYEYESSAGVLKKIFRKTAVATCKVKVAKKTDEDGDDGDEE